MVCFRIGIRIGIRSQRHCVDRSSSTACSADVQLGGASGGTEAQQDPHSDRGGSHGYHRRFKKECGVLYLISCKQVQNFL